MYVLIFTGKSHWEIVKNYIAMMSYVWKKATATGELHEEWGQYRTAGRPKKERAEGQQQTRLEKVSEVREMFKNNNHAGTILAITRKHMDLFNCIDEAQKADEMEEFAEMTMKLQVDASNFFDNLYPWQKMLKDILDAPSSPRLVYWVYEDNGNTGKSTFLNMFHRMNYKNTVVLSNGKATDMKHVASKCKFRKYIFMDLPRTCQEEEDGKKKDYVSYTAIEEIKNGSFSTNKYDGHHAVGDQPHFVVFSNFLPRPEKISWDRWRFMFIDHEDKTCVIKKFTCKQHCNSLDTWEDHLVLAEENQMYGNDYE